MASFDNSDFYEENIFLAQKIHKKGENSTFRNTN